MSLRLRAGVFAAAALAGLALAAPAGADTITPTTFNDGNTENSTCSLREAVQIANADDITGIEDSCVIVTAGGNDDEIKLGKGTYALTITGDDSAGALGDLDVAGATNELLQVTGKGDAKTTIDANTGTPLGDRVFEVHVQSEFDLIGVTARDGTVAAGQGGIAIFRAGANVELINSTIKNGTAIDGAGVHAASTGSFGSSSTDFENSDATQYGGAVFSEGADVEISGGGFENNSAAQGGGAIMLFSNTAGDPDFDLTAAIVHNNRVDGSSNATGGAIWLESQLDPLDPSISDTLITDNRAAPDASATGGGVFASLPAGDELVVSTSRIDGNTATSGTGGSDASGGGMRVDGNLELISSTVNDNTATANGAATAAGGGIDQRGASVALTDVAIEGNRAVATDSGSAARGVGLHMLSGGTSQLDGDRVTIAENSASTGGTAAGGGLELRALEGASTLDNATISENSLSGADSFGGGIAMEDLDSIDASVGIELGHATIAGNTVEATSTSGGEAVRATGNTSFTFHGSIIASDDPAKTCFAVGFFDSLDDNVGTGTTCSMGEANDLQGQTLAQIALGSLNHNGGIPLGPAGSTTQLLTQALGTSSVALNHQLSTACDETGGGPLNEDARDLPRPFPDPGNCDAGAYERNGTCRGKAATMVGTAGPDLLIGTDFKDVVLAGDDDDIVKGGDSKDWLCGESGKDKLKGKDGKDRLDGGPGPGKDLCNGGPDEDKAYNCEIKKKI